MYCQGCNRVGQATDIVVTTTPSPLADTLYALIDRLERQESLQNQFNTELATSDAEYRMMSVSIMGRINFWRIYYNRIGYVEKRERFDLLATEISKTLEEIAQVMLANAARMGELDPRDLEYIGRRLAILVEASVDTVIVRAALEKKDAMAAIESWRAMGTFENIMPDLGDAVRSVMTAFQDVLGVDPEEWLRKMRQVAMMTVAAVGAAVVGLVYMHGRGIGRGARHVRSR